MLKQDKLIFVFLLTFLVAGFIFPNTVFSSSINVDLTIPSFGGGGGGGGGTNPPPVDNPPVISNVSVTSTESTANIAWSATDDNGISSVLFDYGLNTDYGNNVYAGGNSVSLSGLTSGATYYYRIRVTDTGAQLVVYTGSFSTLFVDTTPPTLSSIVVTPGVNSATVSWNSSEPADAQVNYGTTVSYGMNASDASFTTSHSIILPSLVQNSSYNLRIIATDSAGNSTTTPNISFSTLPDTTPPPNVSNLAVIGSSYPTLAWTNPGVSDFSHVVAVRKIGTFSASSTDGTQVYTGNLQSFTDYQVSSTPHYYYTLFSVDTSGNNSSGAFIDWQHPAPPNEVCTNGIDDDGNGLTDCADPACSTHDLCRPPTANEICNNNVDDDGNNLTDCADPACTLNSHCMIVVIPPTSTPGGNGGAGGQGGSGNGGTGTQTTTTTTTVVTSTTPVINVPENTVPEFVKLSLDKVKFYSGNRQIQIWPSNRTISGLTGSDLTIEIDSSVLPSKPNSMILTIGGNQDYILKKEGDNNYYVDVVFPSQNTQAYVKVDYGSDQVDVLTLSLAGISLGEVKSGGKIVSGTEVTLYSESGDVFPALYYGGTNPYTAENGRYGWVVPNGKYYITAQNNGYINRKTPVFSVTNNIVNLPISLIVLPPPLQLDLKNISAQTQAIAEISIEKIGDAVAVVGELKKDENVQKVASNVVAPASVSVITVSTAVMVPDKIFSFFQLVFFQPILLVNRKKRKGWGQVYNAFNKLPIDLAIVRLISVETGKVVQSKVTDAKGKYAFMVKPGQYTIQVTKKNFQFPSSVLQYAKADGSKADIYHGETINVTEENAVITVNIPLDPFGDVKPPNRIFVQQLGRKLQQLVAWSGFALTLVSLYFSPRWYVWAMLVVHFVLILVFYRLALPPKVRSWGIVYDDDNKRPVGRVIARLFNLQFNKLVATQITDNKGRYYFLAGDNNYYITYEHPSYVTKKTETINLTGKEAESINYDVGLSKFE